jgi:hypothetical protein
VVVALLLVGWAVALVEGHDLPVRLHGLGTTCELLPAYEELAPQLEGARRVVFVGEGQRQLFCAQRDLAPVPLEGWPVGPLPLAGQDLTATTVMVNLPDPAAIDSIGRELTAAAGDLAVEISRPSESLAVVRIGRRE